MVFDTVKSSIFPSHLEQCIIEFMSEDVKFKKYNYLKHLLISEKSQEI